MAIVEKKKLVLLVLAGVGVLAVLFLSSFDGALINKDEDSMLPISSDLPPGFEENGYLAFNWASEYEGVRDFASVSFEKNVGDRQEFFSTSPYGAHSTEYIESTAVDFLIVGFHNQASASKVYDKLFMKEKESAFNYKTIKTSPCCFTYKDISPISDKNLLEIRSGGKTCVRSNVLYSTFIDHIVLDTEKQNAVDTYLENFSSLLASRIKP